MKKNGFTLIELLAVIVILGIILVIAIPSISSAILNSRKNSFVVTANEFVDGVRMAILNDASLLPEGTTPKYFNISDIKIEKGSKTTSSFHKNYTSSSYIQVGYNEATDEYIYSVCLVDESGNGIGEVNNNPINIKDIEVSHISLGGATCTLNGNGGGGSGGDDNGNGDDGETIVEGSSSDWIVSDEPNATGGYTLLSFLGDLENSNSVIVDQDYYNDANISMFYLAFTGVSDTSEMTNLNAYTINIPNIVDGKNITELGTTLLTAVDFANYDPEVEGDPPFIEPRLRIKGVNIPEGIKKISEASDSEEPTGTFVYDVNLSEVNLPLTVTEIGNYVFCGTALSQVTIPKTVMVIGRMAFGHWAKITNITFEGANDGSSQLVNIMASAFENIMGGDVDAPDYALTIPASVTTIGENTFDNNNIGTLTFKGSLDGTSHLKTIGYAAFHDNHISTLVIPSSVEMIDSQAFGQNALTSLVFAGTSTDGSGNDSSHLTTLGSDIGTTFNVDNVTSIIYLPASLINMEHTFSCDYRDSLCTFYINHTSIPETYNTSWAENYARKYILNGSGGYTCVENCP